MDTTAEQAVTPKPKRKYTPRPICTDPNLKYLYKKKPGPRPGKNKKKRKVYAPERTDAEQRRFSRRSALRKRVASDPEVAKRLAAHILPYHALQKLNPVKYSRTGIPDGMNRAQADEAWAKARVRAEEMYAQMVDKGIVAATSPEDFERVTLKAPDGTEYEVIVPVTDEGKASAALKEAMVMAIGPMCNQQTKLGALNTVLKFTKSPPATKVEVTKSEDLLAAAIADMNRENGDK